MAKLISYFMLVVYTVISTFTVQYGAYRQADSDVNLTVAMLSDTHIDAKELLVQNNLRMGLKNMKRIKGLDAILVDGDLTNYGDEKSLELFYDIVRKCAPTQELIVSYGNHDIGHTHDLGMTSDEAREQCLRHYNDFKGTDYDKIYYSTEVNGYKFITVCDEGDHWDECVVSNEQLAFLDRELAEGTKDGKPVFVCCHWPMDGKNGEDTVSFHQDGTYADENDVDGFQDQIKAVLEKHKNVFWISGHMHKGFDGSFNKDRLGFSWAEKDENGVHYVNLPTYGLVNIYGVFWWGTGSVLEVYDDHVTFRAVSYRLGLEARSSTVSFDLD